MKYYIVAGERSGDLHGGNLVKALLRRDKDAQFRGFGGDDMQKAGVHLFVHYNELAFMGFVALITNAFKIFKYIRLCKNDIRSYKPDVIILIDYGGFNRRIAKYGKAHSIKVFYYIPPKVWAWYQSRAWELKANVDKMFVILPFEKEFFKKYDFEVDYVGNPVLDAIKDFKADDDFLAKQRLDRSNKRLVALLPGSRKMELKRIVPLMAEVVKMNPQYQFIVAAVSNLPEELYAPLKAISEVKFIYNASYDLLSVANAAIVTSGTATLETGLFKVPQVVVYIAGNLEYIALKRLVKVKFISLVNLIADKLVVKELIQEEATKEKVTRELSEIIQNDLYRSTMIKEYDQIYQLLDIGSASENAAELMVKYLQ